MNFRIMKMTPFLTVLVIVLVLMIIATNIMLRKGKQPGRPLLIGTIVVWAIFIIRCSILIVTGG